MTTATQHTTTSGQRFSDQAFDSTAQPSSQARDGGRQGSLLGDPERVSRGLGWFSIGLGLAEIAAPGSMARMIGIDDSDSNRRTLFAFGIREIASGLAILATERAAVPVWSRVGGDMMDLAFLGREMRSDSSQRNRVMAATAAVAGVTLLDVLTGQQLSRESGSREGQGAQRASKGIEVRRAVTVWRPQEEVYQFWRNFENLPRFMEHLDEVRVLDDRRSHWKARAPMGSSVEWDAEITDDRPNELIAWRAVQEAEVPNQGMVRFLPSPHGGTEVRVELRYAPPGGRLGQIVAKLFGEEPDLQIASDLRRFKQVLELGEIVHSDASIHRKPHPARPFSPEESDLQLETAQPQARGGAR